MTMQRRHFELIAEIIECYGDDVQQRECALHFANYLLRTNPQFDRARFLKACGVEE